MSADQQSVLVSDTGIGGWDTGNQVNSKTKHDPSPRGVYHIVRKARCKINRRPNEVAGKVNHQTLYDDTYREGF